MKQKIKNAYNLLAEKYYDSRKNKTGISYFYNELLEMPATLKLLGNLKGKKVLDLGCGPGLYIEKLKNKCKEIKGIDLSQKEVEIAKNNNPQTEILVGDIEKLPYKNNEFDIIFSSLVLGHLNSWEKTLKEVKRVLKSNGIFIFSIPSPIKQSSKKKKWFFRKFRVIGDYFDENKVVGTKWRKDKKISTEMVHYHKTFETIIKTILKNGFEIIDYEDCKPSKRGKEFSPKQYKKTINIPAFCVWKLKLK